MLRVVQVEVEEDSEVNKEDIKVNAY